MTKFNKFISTVLSLALSTGMICTAFSASGIEPRYIEVDDMEIMKDYLIGKRPVNQEQYISFDLDSDGTVDVFDFIKMRYDFAVKNGMIKEETSKLIEVSNIMQNPELPTGCEVTSLTILLNHLGYPVNKVTMARNYLPKQGFYWENGIYYGADFRTTFAGDPESEYSYGCYAPCILTTASNYFEDNGLSGSVFDITGTDFDSLLSDYIKNDIPVLIWITSSNLHEPYYTSIWTTPDGEQVQWLAYEHCVVLTGYDKDNDIIYVSDPLVGNTSYDYSKIRQRYIDLGQQAVYIQN